MRAVTVRDKATGKIVCMGPADGMYDPAHNPSTQTKQTEDDYEGLIVQHTADLQAQPKPPSLEERIVALEAKVR